MKPIQLFIAALVCLMFSHCKKNDTAYDTTSPRGKYVDSAIARLKDLIPKDHFATLNISNPNVLQLTDEKVAIQIFQQGSNYKKFILLRKAGNSFTGTWVDISGLETDATKNHSGTFSVTNLVTKSEDQFIVKDNLLTDNLLLSSVEDKSRSRSDGGHQTNISTPKKPELLDEFIVQGYASYSYLSFFSLYWLFGQANEYTYCYVPDYSYVAGYYFTNLSNMEIIPVIDSPDHPILNIAEELKCFTKNNRATYTISVNINQPSPNSRSIVNVNSDHKVGHTYFTLQETTPDDNIIIRNVGFYPKKKAKPGKEIDTSSFGDDSYTPSCISLKISVTANEFSTLINNLLQQENFKYDLDNFNCTTSVLKALMSINIKLPATIGNYKIFEGYNPGDLGQDIRQLNLKNFTSENQGRKIVRTVKNINDLFPPEAQGYCK